MVSSKITVKCPGGLHVRPAAGIVSIVNGLSSSVTIIFSGTRIPADSPMHIMAAAIKYGAEIKVECDGENEDEDLREIIEYLNGL